MKTRRQYQNPNYSTIVTTINEIRQSSIKLEGQLSKIKEIYQEKISNDELKNKQFEIMVDELQRYKNNFVFETVQKRIYLELIGINDRLEELLKIINGDLPKKEIVEHLTSFQKQLMQILINQGVDQIYTDSDRFDPKNQEAVDVVKTEKPEEDQLINEVVAKGFIYDNKKILRPEKVVVKMYSNQIKKEV
jgi:molecular chaperone GrpE (heat shock protein)